jgi:hypothetical protein
MSRKTGELLGQAKLIQKHIISTFLRPIYRYLASNTRLVAPSLRLLLAINTFSKSMTRELHNNFNLSLKCLPSLINHLPQDRQKKKSKTNKMSVRETYLRFLMGFFVLGDTAIRSSILELPDFLGFIFNGFYADTKEVLTNFFNRIIITETS